jgi:hypothetical protein
MWIETFGESVTFGVIRGKDKLHYLWVSPHGVGSKKESMVTDVTFLVDAIVGSETTSIHDIPEVCECIKHVHNLDEVNWYSIIETT